jgi:hypothetical protein
MELPMGWRGRIWRPTRLSEAQAAVSQADHQDCKVTLFALVQRDSSCLFAVCLEQPSSGVPGVSGSVVNIRLLLT